MFNIYSKIESSYQDLSIPRLVSYPRTGSHWLRIMMEAYLEMPCGPQAFFYPANSVWGLHIHDRFVGQKAHEEGPVVNLRKVIYLHRDPIDTIFSQLQYESKTNITDQDVETLIEEYASHLIRWKKNNLDIGEILDISYEEMKADTAVTLSKIFVFLGFAVNESRVRLACEYSSKAKTKQVTAHDENALNSITICT